jgi:hypothetical protein
MRTEPNAHSFGWADLDADGVPLDGPERERPPLLSVLRQPHLAGRDRPPEMPRRGMIGGAVGWCAQCERVVPAGPDLCLGRLPGVDFACCGHGDTEGAYVSLSDGRDHYGQAALDWFSAQGVGPATPPPATSADTSAGPPPRQGRGRASRARARAVDRTIPT